MHEENPAYSLHEGIDEFPGMNFLALPHGNSSELYNTQDGLPQFLRQFTFQNTEHSNIFIFYNCILFHYIIFILKYITFIYCMTK